MPRVIFKCPYLKGGSERAASHLHNYVRYMATREGAQHMAIGHEQLPATEEQRKMVAQLLREFPLSRGLFEYEDYQTAPTRGNASEFITRALEDNYDQIAKRDNYVSYIASRPRAQRAGAHALFTGSDAPLVLSQIAAEVAHHPGNVWLPIISLRREDAARLGYDDAGQWKNLIAGYAMEMAEAMKIPWEQFRWYAAFHDQGHHPHIHMVCYSADGRSGYLTREGIARIKSDLAKRIFHQELHELYERQTQRRDELTQEAGVVMAELVQQKQSAGSTRPIWPGHPIRNWWRHSKSGELPMTRESCGTKTWWPASWRTRDTAGQTGIRPYSRRSSTAVLRSAAGTGRSRSEKRRHRWSCGGCAAVPRLPGWNSRP